MIKKLFAPFATAMLLLTACGVPAELLQKVQNTQKEQIDVPIDYALLLPRTTTFEQWDADYNQIEERFLTQSVMRTQLGFSYEDNGVRHWSCVPSARTHAQLDTNTLIPNRNALVGNWRNVCNRRILCIDSAVFADNKMYRSSELLQNETASDGLLSITDTKFTVFEAKNVGGTFERVLNRNYDLVNQRILMLYNASKANAAISFIGIDKEGRLILNSYAVQERQMKGKYITYQAIIQQMIFKKLP